LRGCSGVRSDLLVALIIVGCCLWLGIELYTSGVSFGERDRTEHLAGSSPPTVQLSPQVLASNQVTLILSRLQHQITFSSTLVSLLSLALKIRSHKA